MTATPTLPAQRDHSAHADPLGQAHVRITVEDDAVTWQLVCCCGKPQGHPVPMPPEAMGMFTELRTRARRNAVTTVTLAVIDFKEVSR